MTAAAQTSEPTNPPTGAECLLAAARWLALVLLIHWLISGARRLAAALRQGASHPDFLLFAKRFGTDDPAIIRARVTLALRRATAFEDELLATGPADPRMHDVTHRRAMAARIIDICTDLGIFRAKATSAVAKHVHQRVFHRLRRTSTARHSQARSIGPLLGPMPLLATGPPGIHRGACPRAGLRPDPGDAENAETKIKGAGVSWNFSRRAPASFSSYALS